MKLLNLLVIHLAINRVIRVSCLYSQQSYTPHDLLQMGLLLQPRSGVYSDITWRNPIALTYIVHNDKAFATIVE